MRLNRCKEVLRTFEQNKLTQKDRDQVIRILKQTAQHMPVKEIAKSKGEKELKEFLKRPDVKKLLSEFKEANKKRKEFDSLTDELQRKLEDVANNTPFSFNRWNDKFELYEHNIESKIRAKIDNKLNSMILKVLSKTGDKDGEKLIAELTEMKF